MKQKICIILGTRPEAIKLAPVIRQFLNKRDLFETLIVTTGQHRTMLDQVLDFFEIKSDVDLNLMKPNQSLSGLTAEAILKLSPVLSEAKPSMVLVQGDTTTAFVSALCAYYHKIPVGHVEAGLRTGDLYSPFPEEANRKLISEVAQIHFAPTQIAHDLLISENKDPKSVFMTGNTVIDALQEGLKRVKPLDSWFEGIVRKKTANQRLILITGHRRESFGEAFEAICHAIRDLSLKYSDDLFIYPVHLNPHVQKPVFTLLNNLENVILIKPVDYQKMIYLMQKSYLILTDSGGIQEEAPSLKVPVLVMREKTERPEAISCGASRLVGSQREKIFSNASLLLDNPDEYKKMQVGINPFGDGNASGRIIQIIKDYLKI